MNIPTNKKIYNNYSKRLDNIIYFVVFIDATKTKKSKFFLEVRALHTALHKVNITKTFAAGGYRWIVQELHILRLIRKKNYTYIIGQDYAMYFKIYFTTRSTGSFSHL